MVMGLQLLLQLGGGEVICTEDKQYNVTFQFPPSSSKKILKNKIDGNIIILESDKKEMFSLILNPGRMSILLLAHWHLFRI